MILTTSLRLMFCRSAPYKGVREFRHDALVQSVTELFNSGITFGMQNDGGIIVWTFPLGFGVDTNHVTATVEDESM